MLALFQINVPIFARDFTINLIGFGLVLKNHFRYEIKYFVHFIARAEIIKINALVAKIEFDMGVLN